MATASYIGKYGGLDGSGNKGNIKLSYYITKQFHKKYIHGGNMIQSAPSSPKANKFLIEGSSPSNKMNRTGFTQQADKIKPKNAFDHYAVQLPKLMHGKHNLEKKNIFMDFKNQVKDQRIGKLIESMRINKGIKTQNPAARELQARDLKQQYGFSDSEDENSAGGESSTDSDKSITKAQKKRIGQANK